MLLACCYSTSAEYYNFKEIIWTCSQCCESLSVNTCIPHTEWSVMTKAHLALEKYGLPSASNRSTIGFFMAASCSAVNCEYNVKSKGIGAAGLPKIIALVLALVLARRTEKTGNWIQQCLQLIDCCSYMNCATFALHICPVFRYDSQKVMPQRYCIVNIFISVAAESDLKAAWARGCQIIWRQLRERKWEM